MDTRSKCIEIVSEIARSYNCEISFNEGEPLDYFASVDTQSGVISFPIFQETLLILDELDNGERILLFYLILCMLDNDDYEMCDELLTKLESYGLPLCTDSENMHKNVLIKQLYIILHEFGHYLYKSNDKARKILSDALSVTAKSAFSGDEGHLDSSSIINKFEEKNLIKSKEESKRYSDLLNSVDYNEIDAKNLSNQNSFEETAVDYFSILSLDLFFSENQVYGNHKNNKKAIAEAAIFVYILAYISFTFRLMSKYGIEYITKMDSNSLLFTISHRFSLFIIILDTFFEDSSLSFDDIYVDVFSKIFKPIINKNTIYDSYIEKWIDGNSNYYDESAYDLLYKRIINYANSLKGLYTKQ